MQACWEVIKARCENTPEVFPGDLVDCCLFWALISSNKIRGDKAGLASRGGEERGWECSRSLWSAEGLARCEESGPGGCWRGVGKSSEMTQPRMKEREFCGREGKLKTGFFSIFASLQRGWVGLGARKAGLDAENVIKKEEP